MAINFNAEKPAAQALAKAYESGDAAEIEQAWAGMHKSIAEAVAADFKEYTATQDKNILAQRGYRQLTNAETKWYQRLIEAMKSDAPKQAFATIIGSDEEADLMPTTIIEDVFKDLEAEHPLLSKINFQYVGYITKWIMNDHTEQTAAWGKVNSEIAQAITSAFKVFDIKQNKLSAYAFIERDMLDLGPTFLDGYIRRCLKEAMACGLEKAIVCGNGVDQPIGLVCDIHEGVSFSSSTGYPKKTADKVTSFAPAEYGKLAAKLAVKENGKQRKLGTLTLVCNQEDYLTKVMPATTVLNANGTYVNDLFPFPTNVVVSNFVDTGKAILAVLDEYGLFLGNGSDVIEFSDDFKFLEDTRYFKTKMFADGKAWDNTSALYLDIAELNPAYITVNNVAAAPKA